MGSQFDSIILLMSFLRLFFCIPFIKGIAFNYFMGKVFKDKPISEITLRRFERPFNEDKVSLIRKFCISLGLLQTGDSRDVIVDILKLFLESSKNRKTLCEWLVWRQKYLE